MKDWHIGWRSAEIYGTQAGLYVCDVPWWAVAIEHLVGWVDAHVFRHRWCCPWEWTFRVPTYSFKRDKDGYLDHTLGGALYSSFNTLACMGHHRETNRMNVSLTDEWLTENGQQDPLEEDV